jgi:16S rRNA (cytosine1402-N4)-methyltransferase
MNKKKRYHKPVMLKKSISSLMIKPNGIYLDLTFGGGSHSKEILSKLKSGKLISFDRDPDSIHIAKLIQHSSFIFINNNFKFIKSLLKDKIIGKIDGIIADLGTSSYQLDNPRRGFSIKKNSLLDMRLNQLKKTLQQAY